MSQRIEIHDELNEESHSTVTKESVGYSNSDFSVSTRLLSSDSSHPLANPHTTGWQYMLPSDQGAVGHPHSYYYPCEPPPNNIILPQQPQSSLSTYINPIPPNPLPSFEHLHTPPGSYSRLSHSPSISPAPSSITDATNIPLHHASSSSSIPFASTGGTDQQSEEEDEDEDEDSDSHSNNPKEPMKQKRTRTAYNNYQVDQLELMFARTHYPDVFNREDLSRKLRIREDRIQVWFQNRRARFRKQERTGSVSVRSRYRQKRLQKIQNQMLSVYPSTTTTYQAGTYPSTYPSTYSSTYPTTYPPAYPTINSTTNTTGYQTTYPPAYPTTYSTTYQTTYPTTHSTCRNFQYPSVELNEVTVTNK